MKNIFKILAVVFGVVALDQITKGILLYLITGGIPMFGSAWQIVPMPYIMAHVTDFFNIVFTWNPGASFSLFRALGEGAPPSDYNCNRCHNRLYWLLYLQTFRRVRALVIGANTGWCHR